MPIFRISYRLQGHGTKLLSDDRPAPDRALAETALYAIHSTRAPYRTLHIVSTDLLDVAGRPTPQAPA